MGPSEILPQGLEDTGQGVGSRTEGGKIRFLVFVKEVGCERSSQLSKKWPKKSFVEANIPHI